MNIANGMYDKDLRQKLITDPKKYYQEFMGDLLGDVEVVVKKNTKNINYIVIPSSSVTMDIAKIQAAGVSTAGSASTVGCGSTIGTATSSASTGSTMSTVGTVACAT